MPSSGYCKHQALAWCTEIYAGHTSINVNDDGDDDDDNLDDDDDDDI